MIISAEMIELRNKRLIIHLFEGFNSHIKNIEEVIVRHISSASDNELVFTKLDYDVLRKNIEEHGVFKEEQRDDLFGDVITLTLKIRAKRLLTTLAFPSYKLRDPEEFKKFKELEKRNMIESIAWQIVKGLKETV